MNIIENALRSAEAFSLFLLSFASLFCFSLFLLYFSSLFFFSLFFLSFSSLFFSLRNSLICDEKKKNILSKFSGIAFRFKKAYIYIIATNYEVSYFHVHLLDHNIFFSLTLCVLSNFSGENLRRSLGSS